MLDHKLSKNGFLQKIRSVVQQIMISQTDFTLVIYDDDDDDRGDYVLLVSCLAVLNCLILTDM